MRLRMAMRGCGAAKGVEAGNGNTDMAIDRKQALEQIAQAAVACEEQTGCPALLLAAQCILESGWLAHAPGNNCFGIKQYTGAYGRQLLRTQEWFGAAELARFLDLGDGRTAKPVLPARQDARGRHLYDVMDWFATFATLADCFAKRAALFSAGRYAPFAEAYRQHGDIEAYVRGIAPIYATDPGYAKAVLSLVDDSSIQGALRAARQSG